MGSRNLPTSSSGMTLSGSRPRPPRIRTGSSSTSSPSKRWKDTEVSLEEFLPSSRRDPEEMLAELMQIGQGIENDFLKQLVMAFLENEEFTVLFKRAPGAKRLHHSFLGGLLEHTLSVVKLIQKLKGYYEGINHDLLLAGGVLHDIGKVYELSYERSFDYTDAGRLVGHIVMGVEMVDKEIARIEGFPAELAMLMKHLLLSHHGQYEWGSPTRPMTLEAQMLHHLDDLDAKVKGIQEFMAKGAGRRTLDRLPPDVREVLLYWGGGRGVGILFNEKFQC